MGHRGQERPALINLVIVLVLVVLGSAAPAVQLRESVTGTVLMKIAAYMPTEG